MKVSINMDSMTTMTTVKNNDDHIIETSEYRKHDDTRWMTAVIIIATIIALVSASAPRLFFLNLIPNLL